MICNSKNFKNLPTNFFGITDLITDTNRFNDLIADAIKNIGPTLDICIKIQPKVLGSLFVGLEGKWDDDWKRKINFPGNKLQE